MASGEKKYGLIEPKKKISVADVFNNDSDSGDERELMKRRLQKDAEKGAKKQTIIDINRALEQDPTVYQYDEVYDTIKKPEREASKATVVRKVKYMDALLKTADKRKKENERRTERLVQKEREAEGDQFKDKEEFITSSYRAKLEEMKKAEEEEKKMDYIESIMDVTKQQDLGSFYRQLYKETVPEGESNVLEKPVEPVNDEAIKTEVTEKAASSSSSSGSDSSSDSSSSSSDSSSDDEKSKKDEKVEQADQVASTSETLSSETPVVPEPDAVAKSSENDAKFNNTKKRDRTYRQRESSPKRTESEREPAKGQNSSHRKSDERSRRDDRGRDYARGSERDRDRVRSRRDDHRSSRNVERYRSNRNDSRRQRSRSRTNREKDGPRNSYNTDRRRPQDQTNEDKREKSGKVTGEPAEKRSKEEVGNKSDKKENVKPEKVASNGNVDSSEKEEKTDIWKKRTVGAVYEAALERYFQRKAARGS